MKGKKQFLERLFSFLMIMIMVVLTLEPATIVKASASDNDGQDMVTVSDNDVKQFDATIEDTPTTIVGSSTIEAATNIETNKLYMENAHPKGEKWYKINFKEDGYGQLHFMVPAAHSLWTVYYNVDVICVTDEGKYTLEQFLNVDSIFDEKKEKVGRYFYYPKNTNIYVKVDTSNYLKDIGVPEYLFYISEKKVDNHEYEFNNDVDSANLIEANKEYLGGFDFSDVDDWYKVKINKKKPVEVLFTNTSNTTGHLIIEVYEYNKSKLEKLNGWFYEETSGNKPLCLSSDKIKQPKTDTIYIKLHKEDGSRSIHNYKFQVTNEGAESSDTGNADVTPVPFGKTLVVGEKIDFSSSLKLTQQADKYRVYPKGAVKVNKKTGVGTIKKAVDNVVITAFVKEGGKSKAYSAVSFKSIKPVFKKDIPAATTPGQVIDMTTMWSATPEVPVANWLVNCDADVATINAQGKLTVTSTLRKSKKIKVTALFGNGVDQAKYTATLKISLPKLNKTKVTIKNKPGKKFKLSVKNTKSLNIKFVSDNTSVATVDSTGTITPVATGSTVVKCFVDEVPYECQVTVK